jgi:hypothetical protein
LSVVDRVKDVGVVMNRHLTFNQNTFFALEAAFTRANLIHVSRDTVSLTRDFTVYFRPLLDYGTVTSPLYGKIIRIKKLTEEIN